MLELIIIDDNQARYKSLSSLLGKKQWSVTHATLKDMKKLSLYSGMMLILDQDETKLNQALNQPVNNRLVLNGHIDTIKADALLPLKDYILLRVSTVGKLSVNVN